MTFKYVPASIAAILLASASPALAQADPFAPGTQVTDTQGNVVGTVSAVNGEAITVKTDKLEANLAKDSFTPHDGKLLFGMTQAELNTAIEADQAAVAASLQPGATVTGSAGAAVGTIESIDAEFATLKLTSGKLVKIPRSGIAGAATGAIIGIPAADLEAQAASAN